MSMRNGGTHSGSPRCNWYGSAMKRSRSAAECTGRTTTFGLK